MELQKYNLEPQEQLAVSLYLKSMNKTQAARDAGYGSASVFSKPQVKAAIAEQLSIRAERLRVGGDWVLMELKRVYDRCMQIEEVKDVFGQPTGEIRFDANNAIKALNLIGKHVDVKAFDVKESNAATDDELIVRLTQARKRIAKLPEPPATEQLPVIEDAVIEADTEEEPPVSFLVPATHSADLVTDASEPDAMLSDAEKLEQLMEHWRKDTSSR